MKPGYDDNVALEVERDIQRLRDCRKRAEEIVRDRGWSEEDEDFEFQIEQEVKEQWSEAFEREWEREQLFLEEMTEDPS